MTDEHLAKIGVHPPTGHVWVERGGRVLAQAYDRADAEEIVAALNAKTALEQTDAANARADGLLATIEQVRAEVEELRRQGYPVGVLLRILAKAPSAALARSPESRGAPVVRRTADGTKGDHIGRCVDSQAH